MKYSTCVHRFSVSSVFSGCPISFLSKRKYLEGVEFARAEQNVVGGELSANYSSAFKSA